jgi:hypothetical protein
MSPSLPLVGSWVLPVATAGDAEGEAPGDAEAPDGLGLAEGLGLGLGLGEGVGAADGLALAVVDAAGDGLPLGDVAADADGETEPDAPGLPDGTSVGTGVGDGGAALSPIGAVLISRKWSPVETTEAGRPFAVKTATTWSGVTSWFLKRISHFVPPV